MYYIHLFKSEFHLFLHGACFVFRRVREIIQVFKPFPHTTNFQQTTLKSSGQKYGISLKSKVDILNRVKNIVTKGEITRFE